METPESEKDNYLKKYILKNIFEILQSLFVFGSFIIDFKLVLGTQYIMCDGISGEKWSNGLGNKVVRIDSRI